MLLNFASMFIVAPLTTSMSEAYGVYSLCISFNIFLRYADLGFIAAGRKYAAEAFAVSNHEKERRYVGTSMSIYGGMSMLLFLFALFFAAYPEYIIKDIEDSIYYDIAHQLLFVLALTFPLSVIQKFNSLIYSVRIEEYKIQSFQIVGSIIKIASVPLYFFNKRYDIVGYYLFCEIINLLISMFVLWYSKDIGYGMKNFVNSLKFDKKIFKEIKPLALSGFASVVGWITFYELDTVGVSVLLGANAVAIYAVGKQIQTFVRTFINIAFSPYPVRINYFIGQNDFDGLRIFYYKLSEVFSFLIIPIIVIFLFAKPFVISWVGDQYEESVSILQLLVLTFLFHYVTCQGSSVIYGLNKVKDILKLAFIQPFFFWIGVILTYHIWGVVSFAIFKLAACFVTELYTCYLTCKYLKYAKMKFYWHLLTKPMLLFLLICLSLSLIFNPLLENVNKGHHDMIYVVSIMALCCLISLIIDFLLNKSMREETKAIFKYFRN